MGMYRMWHCLCIVGTTGWRICGLKMTNDFRRLLIFQEFVFSCDATINIVCFFDFLANTTYTPVSLWTFWVVKIHADICSLVSFPVLDLRWIILNVVVPFNYDVSSFLLLVLFKLQQIKCRNIWIFQLQDILVTALLTDHWNTTHHSSTQYFYCKSKWKTACCMGGIAQ